MRIYLAGSSAELDRCRLWDQRLRTAGIEVVSTWIANVLAVGEANPRDATREQRAAWAREDLEQIGHADHLWVLWPERLSAALIEFGFVLGSVPLTWRIDGQISISGDTKRSIFCALGREYPSDEAAFAALVSEAGR